MGKDQSDPKATSTSSYGGDSMTEKKVWWAHSTSLAFNA